MKNNSIKKVNKKGTKKPVEVKEESFLDKIKSTVSKLIPKKIDSKLVEEAYHDNELWEKGESWAASLANKVKSKVIQKFSKKNGNGSPIKSEALMNMLEDLEAEKKKAEESQKKYRLLYETSNDAIMTLAPPNERYTSGNPATIKMFGCKNEKQFISLSPAEVSPKKQPDGQLSTVKAKQMIMKAMKDGSNFFEWTHKKYMGENFLATVLLSKIEESGKKYLQATVRDITKQKKAEERLKYLSSITENTSDSIVISDINFKINYINKAAQDLFGYTLEELKGKSPDILNAAPLAKKIQQELYKVVSSGKEYIGESLNKRKDGSTFVCQYKVSQLKSKKGKLSGYIGIQRDVTEIKKAENKLKEAKKKFQTLFDQSPDGVFLFDVKKQKIIEFNTTIHQNLGYTREEFAKLNVADIEAIEKPENVKKHIQTQIKMRGETFETKHRKKDGTMMNVLVTSKMIKLGGKDFAIGIFRDITAQKKAEKELKKNLTLISEITKNSQDAIFAKDAQRRYTFVNPAAEKMIGLKAEKIIGKTAEQLFSKKDSAIIKKVDDLCFKGKKVNETYQTTIGNKTSYLHTSQNPSYSNGKINGIIGIVRDVTEKKKTEKKLQMTADINDSIIVQLDKQGTVKLINQKGTEILGYKAPTQIVGKNWFENFLPQKIRAKVKKFSDQMLAGKVIVNEMFENPILTKSGKELMVVWQGEMIKDAKGNIIGHLSAGKVIFQDIPEKKKTEKSRG